MEHTLPKLKYKYEDLEPHIDAKTIQIHHDIHHQGYVDGLNKAEKALKDLRSTGDFALIKHWERELAFHGSGHILHSIYWENMSPKGGGQPSDATLNEYIKKEFGSFDAFKNQMIAATNAVEGSGWGILGYHKEWDRLVVLQCEKHQDLTQWGIVPLIALDVWEHAYYLRYQNKRAEYTKAWFNVVNWKDVAARLKAASK